MIGEPSGTAGMPILNVITSNGLTNILVIVTRYFGGILLGTGGLVKAYTNATLETLKKADFITEKYGMELKIKINYQELEGLKYFCKKNDINIIKLDYTNYIECVLEVLKEEKDKIIENTDNKQFKVLEYEIIKEKNIRKNTEK